MRAAVPTLCLLAAFAPATSALAVALTGVRPLVAPVAPRHHLPALRSIPAPRLQAAAAAGDSEGKGGPLAKLSAMLPPKKELKKVIPLGLMFFFILFDYTILRDAKDILLSRRTRRRSSFLKAYVACRARSASRCCTRT